MSTDPPEAVVERLVTAVGGLWDVEAVAALEHLAVDTDALAWLLMRTMQLGNPLPVVSFRPPTFVTSDAGRRTWEDFNKPAEQP